MAKVLDEQSRKAVADTLRYYRELGIYDLYRREVPEGVTFGRTIVARRAGRAGIADGEVPAAEALAVRRPPPPKPPPMPRNLRPFSATSPPRCA